MITIHSRESRCKLTRSGKRVRFIALFLLAFLISCNPSYGQHAQILYKIDDYPINHLVWSPTGMQLAFSSIATFDNFSTLYIYNVETNEVRLVEKDHGFLLAETWTPDEKELLFYGASSKFNGGIWIVNVTSKSPPTLLLESGNFAAWSIKGKLAISRKNPNGNIEISIRDDTPNEETILFSEPAIGINTLVWSANSSKLVFNLNRGEPGRIDIYVIDLETQKTYQITNAGANDSPSLSPNGKMVAYRKGDFSNSRSSYTLHVMNSDGTCDTEVFGLRDIGDLAWSPDGKYIAFVGKKNSIFLLNLERAFGNDFLVNGLSCK